MTLALLLGAGVGLGVLGLGYALVPPRQDLAAAVTRFDTGRRRAAARRIDQQPTWRTRAGRRAGEALAARGMDLGRLHADLELTDRRLDKHLADALGYALGGFLAPPLVAALLAAAGLTWPVPLTLALAVALAAALVWATNAQVHREADRRRDELRHVLGSYLDLVAMSLTGGRGVPEALPAAAAIGHGWAFELIATTLARARYTGTTPWQALGELGERVDLAELRDLAASVKLVSDDGAQVAASLSARASTLRRRELAAAEGQAQQSSQSMRIAQLLLAVGFLVFLLYPAVINIFHV